MEEIRSAMEQQMDLMSDLIQKLSGDLRTGLQPAYENFMGFFHAIDWKVIMSLFSFYDHQQSCIIGIVGLRFIL